MDDASRLSAHAAQQRSCTSLPLGNPWRSLASGAVGIGVKAMRQVHSSGDVVGACGGC